MSALQPLPEPVPDSSGLAPAERLRLQLLQGKGRFSVVLGTLLIWLMDTALSRQLVSSGAVGPAYAGSLNALEWASTIVFIVTTVVVLAALLRPYPRALVPAAAVYLAAAVLQVVANVLGMLSTAASHQGGGLGGLWDVGGVYAMSVTVFMFVYVFLDLTTPGGAFVWPSRDGHPPPTPNLFDYLFISLNVNSTYGPTSEAVMSRRAKLVMSLQVLLAILMLTVLISRAVAATS